MQFWSATPIDRDSPPPWLRCGSLGTLVVAMGFLFVSPLVDLYRTTYWNAVVLTILTVLALTVCLTLSGVHYLWTEHLAVDRAFSAASSESTSIFENVLDGVLILDDDATCLDGNPAAASILRVPRGKLIGENIGRFFGDRPAFTRNWRSIVQNKTQTRRVRLMADDGTDLFVNFNAVPHYLPGRHVVILRDATQRARAELKIAEQLRLVDAARAEAEGLRKATLALSKNLAMDSVLDTLLECIFELIPFDRAAVLFVENGDELMVAREAPRSKPQRIGLTLNPSQNIFLQRVLFERQAILLADVGLQTEWRDVRPLDKVQSWLGVPLLAGGHVLGILSLGAYRARTFTTEHLRLAKSLAIPSAVAIQNARIHERAEIYAAELALRLQELKDAQNLLQQTTRKTVDPTSPCRS